MNRYGLWLYRLKPTEEAFGEESMKVSATEQALLGMQRARQLVDGAASRIADPDPESHDIIRDIIDLKFGAYMFKANLIVLKEDQEMQKDLIDILA